MTQCTGPCVITAKPESRKSREAQARGSNEFIVADAASGERGPSELVALAEGMEEATAIIVAEKSQTACRPHQRVEQFGERFDLH
jgi:hypothetical protein